MTDGAYFIANKNLEFTKVGDLWSQIDQHSLLLLQPAIERHVAVWLWDPVILTVLVQPAWLVFLILGSIFTVLGRKKKPLIGYSR